MNDLINKLTEALGPVGSSALGNALIGLAILVIGLFIVKLISSITKKLLSKLAVLKRKNPDGSVTDISVTITSMIKAILTILVLIAVLEHFGLTDVLAPLKEMMNKFATAIPNIVGAAVIGYAGWIFAKVVTQIAGATLAKVDEQLAAKTGNKEISTAKFGSALLFAVILLPIVVSALGVLNIPAISDPASTMINKLLAAVPNIIGAAIVLLVVYYAAKFVIYILSSLLEGMNVNALPEKLHIQGIFTDQFTPVKLTSITIMFFSMVAAAAAAVDILNIDVISEVFTKLLEFGGGLLIGGVILIVGNLLGSIAHEKLSKHGNSGLANIARFAILGLVLAMGLRAMGLADNIVTMAFGFTLGSVAVAVALAFGLGARDAAKVLADNWALKLKK